MVTPRKPGRALGTILRRVAGDGGERAAAWGAVGSDPRKTPVYGKLRMPLDPERRHKAFRPVRGWKPALARFPIQRSAGERPATLDRASFSGTKTMKNILLLVHEDKGQEARLQAALDLARALNGHIRCVDVTQIPVFPGDFDGAMAGMVVAEERKVEAANRCQLDMRLAHEDIGYDWTESVGDMVQCLVNQSRLADLVVVNCKRDAFFEEDRRGLASDLVMSARCPIVAVPDAAVGLNLTGAAIVAWDGSEPAAATLRAVTPILKLARSVHLLSVGEPAEGPSAQEAAVYLSRHDIHAKVHLLEAGADTPDVALLRQAEIDRAAYCVMGAYGHSRLTEAVFGGVTRRMIEAAKIPLILSR